ncbi:D-sedoheptulose-7-phosphate isomerase [Pandoraea apista]|uniref:SIS domain-containing protein n=3 Tax=Pandoraea apista TaxID=93218 RepID=A0A3R8YMX6_9BURK|nr:SIS domain-containing protein [Pandoraea apista]AVF42418.1 SIS domain-containing protein [Pandoraea apista]AVF42420.1 SIS domain-containing protein [Pandoraea apista]OXS95064.1 phosphoheptose isomerase [Pandoraea apista]RRJ31608.1 SIS domain-containing protein [Pandoraea apista]RRJ81313.1 SIS domain-containing protein [Pandoraea apista]
MGTTTEFSVQNYLNAHVTLSRQLEVSQFQSGIEVIRDAFHAGKKVITCGNGGSASTASHYITDWNKMVNLATGKRFRGVSLCDNVGLITAYGNDLAYEEVFCGQLAALADEGDLLVAISGSGNSPNIVKAVEYANANGMITLAVVGYDGGLVKELAQHAVHVPSFDMQLCEDVHLMFGHMVMKTLCGSDIKA